MMMTTIVTAMMMTMIVTTFKVSQIRIINSVVQIINTPCRNSNDNNNRRCRGGLLQRNNQQKKKNKTMVSSHDGRRIPTTKTKNSFQMATTVCSPPLPNKNKSLSAFKRKTLQLLHYAFIKLYYCICYQSSHFVYNPNQSFLPLQILLLPNPRQI